MQAWRKPYEKLPDKEPSVVQVTPLPTLSFVCFSWVRDGRRESRAEVKGGGGFVCVCESEGTVKGAVHTLRLPDTVRPTAAQVSHFTSTRQTGRSAQCWTFTCRWLLQKSTPVALDVYPRRVRPCLCYGTERTRIAANVPGKKNKGKFKSASLCRWQTSVRCYFFPPFLVMRVQTWGGWGWGLWSLIPQPIVQTVEPGVWPGYKVELHCVTLECVSN